MFFKGKPDLILEAWRTGKPETILTAELLSQKQSESRFAMITMMKGFSLQHLTRTQKQ